MGCSGRFKGEEVTLPDWIGSDRSYLATHKGHRLMGDRSYSKVVWSEGMHLAQHHFQAQAKYFESTAAFAVSQLFFKPYGFLDLSLDEEAIRSGSVGILRGQGVTPDGLTFGFPNEDPLPRARDAHGIGDPGREPVRVYLAIPAFQSGGPNCDLDAPGENLHHFGRRYQAEEVAVKDENTGSDQKPVLLARKNFQILFEKEVTDEFVALPLAIIDRASTGHLQYRPDFLPPLLDLAASPRLVGIIDGILEILKSKANTLASRRLAIGHEMADLSFEEVTSYWMAHGIHSGLAGLKHLRELPRCHPEDLYREMTRLGGALTTFSMDSAPGDLPVYNHDDLTHCFGTLEAQLRELLAVMVPESFLSFRLGELSSNLRGTVLDDQRVFRPGTWVLRVSSKSSDDEVLRNVPGLVKVCSQEDIQRLVDDANPGLPVEHLPNPPSSIPRRIGSFYFQLKMEGPCWQLMEARSSIGVYVPDLLSDADLELITIRD